MKTQRKTARRTQDELKLLDRITGDDPQLREEIADAGVNFRVAQMIYDARVAAAMTQQQLAHLVGTRQSVIARLESADYQGHSLTMLSRIADALHQKLEVKFVNRRPRGRQVDDDREQTRSRAAVLGFVGALAGRDPDRSRQARTRLRATLSPRDRR
jgi:ribosome-binding protein aMBF1 (putative translation factor)